LIALDVQALAVEIQPSEGRLTEGQVDEYMKQADCAIILATYGHIVDQKTRKKHPRLNVVDELGRCRNAFPHRTILLLEKGVDLPSNVSGIVYEHFTKQNMENGFIKVARELREFGLIKPVKPAE
jgi:predicted nucleotide-binding protein